MFFSLFLCVHFCLGSTNAPRTANETARQLKGSFPLSFMQHLAASEAPDGQIMLTKEG